MDRAWMREQLVSYRTLLQTCDEENRKSFGVLMMVRRHELNSEINVVFPTVREIVRVINANLLGAITPPLGMQGVVHTLNAVERAIGILDAQVAVKAHLAPDAPALVADQFHPGVWTAGSAIWDTGMYRVAVQQAAVSLSTHIAARAARR
jgi:hypothetical protein